ncbi:dual specificity protein phosphatase 23-like [Penaeus monodon]|uniref:dual specificity protein phosphatase 23-like n=1 Tax=Penaeus monodon TaxID=6687 RepID=UPI0018A73C3E|nr:dual specificity protein phosphatase 23-like [Penaeus monodon]
MSQVLGMDCSISYSSAPNLGVDSLTVMNFLKFCGKTAQLCLFPLPRNKGVRVLVSLCVERRPHRSANRHMECHVIDVEEFEDPSVEQMKEFISICEKARVENKVVCVHCRMGRGRTGVMLACYLVKFYQQEPSQAICNVRLMRPGSVETWEQERAVKNYRDYMG